MTGRREVRETIRAAEKLQRRGRLNPAYLPRLRELRAWLLEQEHGTGCVAARRCQATGALRQLYRPGTQADHGEDEHWLVICAAHGTCVSVDTRRRGELAIAEAEWCDECQEKYEAAVRNDPRGAS
jgi:hypothetical protein